MRSASLLLCAAALLMGTPAHAHNPSYTEAWASFSEDGTFDVALFVADDALHEPLDDFWRRHTELQFDDEVVLPVVSRSRASEGVTLVSLRGEIPADTENFVWRGDSDVGTVVLHLSQAGDDAAVVERVAPGGSSAPFPLWVAPSSPSSWSVLRTYVGLGFAHILPKGADHIAFVLGVFLLSCRLRPLIVQVSAFTLAHSVTLALATLGWIALPASVVEPAIGFSIAAIAIENLVVGELRPWRPALVFGFGLLHGLGFAGMLSNLGLEPGYLATSLVSFNVGVELGQLIVLAIAFGLVGRFESESWYHRWVRVPGSVGIGALGLYWGISRLIG